MEPRGHRLALVVGAILVGGCSAPTGIALDPPWSSAGVAVSRDLFGHNTVWSQGGLGLWDDGAGALVASAVQEVQALEPALLRFPGGTRAMRYHFDQARGATRTPQCDPFKGALDATTYGPDEFLALAATLGADVTWVAPWVDGSPAESARIAAFVADKPAVKFLEIGNEPYLGLPAGPTSGSCGRPSQFVQDERWVADTRVPTTAADYAAQLAATAALVRPAAPALLIGAPATSQYDVASSAMDAVGDVDSAMGDGDAWNARLLSDARDAFDFFVLHPYDFSVDDDARIRLAERTRKTVRELRAAAPEKQIAVTEYGFLFGGGTLLNALVTADMTRMAAEEQLLMSARHILVETDGSGPFADSAAIGPSLQPKPGYFAAQLVRRLAATALPVADLVADGTLVALPTRDDASAHVSVLLIDRRTDDGPARDVRVMLPPGSFAATSSTLTGATLAATDVAVADADLGRASGSVHVVVPAHSVVVLSAAAQ
jgi:hypothetical protein